MNKVRSHLLLLVVNVAFALCFGDALSAAESQKPEEPAVFTVKVSGAGRPMILIPGLSCGGDVWDGTVAHFKDTHTCHVVTLAGFAGQPAIGAPFLERVRDALIRYIRDQKLERPVVVGHSLGAFLAFWMSAKAPDEIGPVIAGDGVPFYPALQQKDTTTELQKPVAGMLRKQIAAQAPMQFAIGNQFTLATMISNAKDLEKVAAASNRSNPKAVGQALYELFTTDLREEIRAIKSPVLLLAAITPGSSPEETRKVEESYGAQISALPHGKLVLVPNSRHFIQLDQPEFFFREVKSFLESAGSDREN